MQIFPSALLFILMAGFVHLTLLFLKKYLIYTCTSLDRNSDPIIWVPTRSIVHFYESVDDGHLNLMEAVLNGIDHSEKQTAQLKLNDTVSDNITWCPKTPPDLEGRIQVHSDLLQLSEIEKLYPSLEFGGHGRPATCRARHRVAIIVPYRNRQEQLSVFLRNMHAFLSKQQLDYAIFIVEQTSGDTFNRAKLMNIGFVEAMKTYDWQCFVFHDVDLLPEDDRNLYWCPKQPRHMSVAVDKFDYKLPYSTIFGGVTALTRTHMKKMHGFPNEYWGWGGEDDDIFQRLVLAGHQVSRYPAEIARYKMIKHSRERGNSVNGCRHQLLERTKKLWRTDGLSSLYYKRISLTRYRLYTSVKVDLFERESRNLTGIC